MNSTAPVDPIELCTQLSRDNVALRSLLNRHHHELANMRLKLAAKEDEGWEGTRRRDVLQRETVVALAERPSAPNETELLREENKFLHDALDAFEWQRINAMSHEEVRKELLADGYTEERLNAGFAKIKALINRTKDNPSVTSPTQS